MRRPPTSQRPASTHGRSWAAPRPSLGYSQTCDRPRPAWPEMLTPAKQDKPTSMNVSREWMCIGLSTSSMTLRFGGFKRDMRALVGWLLSHGVSWW